MKIKFLALSAFLPALALCDVFNPDPKNFPDWSKTGVLTPEHVVQAKRLQAYSVSPNSKQVVYGQFQYNKTDNKQGSHLKLLDLTSSTFNSVPLTEYSYGQGDSNPIWMDDNTVLFTATRGSPAVNLFSISTIDKKITQVTNYTNSISGVVYNSKSGRIVFVASVYKGMGLDESTDESNRISDLPSSGVVFDKLFIRHWDTWITKERTQLFTVSVGVVGGKLTTTGKPVNLAEKYTGEWGLEPDRYEFSPDGTTVLFSAKIEGGEEAWQTEVGIFTAPVDGSAAPTRHNLNFKGAASSPVYSPDGKNVAWLQMATPGYESDQNQVILYEMSTGKQTRLIPDLVYSPSAIAFSKSGKSMYMTIPTEKDIPIFKLDLTTQTLTRLTGDGSAISFTELSDDNLISSRSTFQYPPRLHMVKTDGSKIETPVTFENDNYLKSLWVSPTEYFWFDGAMNEKVQALVLYPYGFDPAKKYPVAVIIHGGPQASWADRWSTGWNINTYTNQGYVVLIVNFHGGDAYGQKFTDSIRHNWGTHPYYDIIKGVDTFLENTCYTDADKLVALGASYGGYMINWVNGHTNRFKALVNHDGVFNLIGMYYSTEELWFVERDLGTPWVKEDRESIESSNPERFVANMNTPTLFIHGDLDFRVPLSEGISAFTALQRRGVDSRLLYYPDENHWVLQPANYLQWQSEMFKWIGKYTNVTTWVYDQV